MSDGTARVQALRSREAEPQVELWVFGLNHRTAPVELRERLAFDAENLPSALAALKSLPGVREAAIVSTCNRTEIYALAEDDGTSLQDWLATRQGERLPIDGYLYRHRDAEAARHLFRVAAGLDSLVLGEPQILGQVKEAWAMARAAGTLGGSLDRLFQQAFGTAKHARTRGDRDAQDGGGGQHGVHRRGTRRDQHAHQAGEDDQRHHARLEQRKVITNRSLPACERGGRAGDIGADIAHAVT